MVEPYILRMCLPSFWMAVPTAGAMSDAHRLRALDARVAVCLAGLGLTREYRPVSCRRAGSTPCGGSQLLLHAVLAAPVVAFEAPLAASDLRTLGGGSGAEHG